MSKWFVNKRKDGRSDIFEEGGSAGHIYCVALDMRPEIAEQIVREHNAHGELVELLKDLRDQPYGLELMHELSEHACEEMIRNTWLPRIDAVIARAEGKELNEKQ
jgi:hypothetical protein